ncbi:MAG TPA: sugar ABC transporter substrate-binding protein [Lachnospiraceae bacterium]|nr:sugar ABC transporter substrate-binding protein [Lachnospiraceae bacterium]
MRKKIMSAVLASAMAVSLLGGCQGGGAQSSSQAADQPESSQAAEDSSSGAASEAPAAAGGEKVKVRILTRYSNPDSVRERYFMDMVAKFQEENPDIELEDVSISDENSRDTLFKTSVASGDPIEVFNFLGYAANLDYVSNGVVTDISSLIEEDPAWTEKYIDALFAPVDYSAYGVEGTYGLPTAPYGVCCFYNKAIFDELNMELPETWEAIEAAAPKLIEAGYIPMAFGAKDNYRAGHFLTALSMKYYGDQLKNDLIAGDKAWNGAETLGLIEKMQAWQEAGIFGDNNLAYDANGELAKLENKEAAIIFSGSWNIATINEFANAGDIVCKGFPYFEEKPEFKDEWMGGPDDFMAISSKPGDPDYDATVRVLKYFTSQEYYEGMYEAQSGAGTYPVKFDETIEADALTTQFNEYYNKATNMIGEIEQFSPMTSLMDVVRTEVTTIFSGDKAQDIADRIQGEVDAYGAGS